MFKKISLLIFASLFLMSGITIGGSTVTSGSTSVLTNKTIDGDLNTIQDLSDDVFKSTALAGKKYLTFVLIDGATDTTADTDIGDFAFESPFAGTITGVGAYVYTAGVTGTMTVDVHLDNATIMATNKISIETGEKSSRDATTQPAITTSALSVGDLITVDIDAIQSGTAAKGLTVWLEVTL
jgi:hypothetical protein